MNPFRLATRLQPLRRARDGPPPGPPGGRASAGAGGGSAAAAEVAAVRAPWHVTQRSPSGVIEVEHRGVTAAHSVRFALAGRGMLGLSLPRTVQPGERVRVTLRGVHAEGVVVAPDAMLMLRWFEADGTELLWPITLC